MKPFRRQRRPDDARYTERDERLWRRLVKAVRAAAHAPNADSTPLHKAGKACCRAVPPAGYAVRGSVFLRLAVSAQSFGHPNREAKAAQLAGMAEEIEAALDAAAQPTFHQRRPRADIDG